MSSDNDLEKYVLDFYNELTHNAWKYESNSTGDNNPNADFFKGKAEAYAYAANKLKNIFDWLDIKIDTREC